MKPTAAVQEASTANVRISGTGNACLQLLDQVHQYFIPLQIHCVAATNAIAHDDMYMHSLSYLHVCTTRYHMQKIVVSTTNSFQYSHYVVARVCNCVTMLYCQHQRCVTLDRTRALLLHSICPLPRHIRVAGLQVSLASAQEHQLPLMPILLPLLRTAPPHHRQLATHQNLHTSGPTWTSPAGMLQMG